MTARHKRFYTLEESFALVKESEERYEYWNGEIFLMGGASPEHVFINLSLELSKRDNTLMVKVVGEQFKFDSRPQTEPRTRRNKINK